MPRTKHALLAVIVCCAMLLLAAIVVFLADEGALDGGQQSTPAFLEEEISASALVYEEDLVTPRRASLIDRLRHYVGISAAEVEEVPLSEETITSAPESKPEGGLLLGNSKTSFAPKVGHIYACQQQSGTSSAFPWIRDAYWFPSEKPEVGGEVSSLGTVSVTTEAGLRTISTNGLPNHSTGAFPVSQDDPSYAYDPNPYTIVSKQSQLIVSSEPLLASAPSCLPTGVVRVLLSGAALFGGQGARGNDAAAHEVFDRCGGHPNEQGIYHYHSESECVVSSVYEGGDSTILGYALDGFGIYASRENGRKLTNDDLDGCHGHVHMIPWNGVLTEMYHYHMTDEYPYSIGCFMGTPSRVE